MYIMDSLMFQSKDKCILVTSLFQISDSKCIECTILHQPNDESDSCKPNPKGRVQIDQIIKRLQAMN